MGFSSHIKLIEGRNSLPEICLKFGKAELVLCLQGAHITSYKPDGETEILWMSSRAVFEPGKSVRGGIPLCWPWFGAHLEDPDKPQHGFARSSRFEVVSSSEEDPATRILLRLNPEEANRQEKRTGLRMEFEIALSERLWIQINTINLSDKSLPVGAALHTYFQVSDIGNARIPQLTNLEYKDKTREFKTFTQSEPLLVDSETDRVFLNPPEKVELIDSGLKRTTKIETWGNTDLVVWNPWIEHAKAMADFDDKGYQSMICIEPANALSNKVLLAPGDQHRLGKSIQLK